MPVLADSNAVPSATSEAVPVPLRRRSLAQAVWSILRRFIAEALEEQGKLYEKNPYAWWL